MTVFHSTFDSVHWTGISLSDEMPVPFGPRKRGQSEACTPRSEQKKKPRTAIDARKRRMSFFSCECLLPLVSDSGIISHPRQKANINDTYLSVLHSSRY